MVTAVKYEDSAKSLNSHPTVCELFLYTGTLIAIFLILNLVNINQSFEYINGQIKPTFMN